MERDGAVSVRTGGESITIDCEEGGGSKREHSVTFIRETEGERERGGARVRSLNGGM